MTLPEPRKALSGMPRYVPGARGDGGPPPIKLSSNENPFDPLPSVVDTISRAAASVNRYPDMFSGDLTEALARRYGLKEDRVVVGAGSVSVLGHVLQAFAGEGDEVVYAWRSFEAYPILVRLSGATPVEIPLLECGCHELDGMADAVTDRTKVVFLCSPNNPTGLPITTKEIKSFLKRVPDRVLVVVDEAYIEFNRDPLVLDSVALLARHPNLLVARTFSKAYGLAGLRIGYALGNPEIVAAIRVCVTPFSVSGIAQAAALASLEAEAELFARVETIVGERGRVLGEVRGQGWCIPQTQGNFFWIGALDEAAALAGCLKSEVPPILVRPFAGEGVRVTIGSPQENDRMTAALAAYPSRF